jgi:hypothetical protein
MAREFGMKLHTCREAGGVNKRRDREEDALSRDICHMYLYLKNKWGANQVSQEGTKELLVRFVPL